MKAALICGLLVMIVSVGKVGGAAGDGALTGATVIRINTPQSPPDWAVKERQLLDGHNRAIPKFYDQFFDDRGWYKGHLTWGMGMGIDDILESCANWPLAYALGASREAVDKYWRAHYGLVEQCGKQPVESAPAWGVFRDGFIAANDMFHIEEMYPPFNQMPVADPGNEQHRKLALQFAGYFLNEGLPAGAEPIYDYQHHIIRSGVIGSLGAILKIEPSFWGFGWKELAGRPAFKDWTKVEGDSPANLAATTFVTDAYLLSGEEKYRRWVLDYVGGWCRQAAANGDIFPANIGLSGKIGEHWDGQWWRQMHGGWGLTRTMVAAAENATLVSGGDRQYLNALRRQIVALQKNGLQGQNGSRPPGNDSGAQWRGRSLFQDQLVRMYLTTFSQDDLALIETDMGGKQPAVGPEVMYIDPFYLVPHYAWLNYLLGKYPEFPKQMLDADLHRMRTLQERMAQPRAIAQSFCGVTAGRSFPDRDWERHVEAALWFLPQATTSLINLTCGGTGHTSAKGSRVVLAEIWHFDPVANRPGLPPDVGALVDKITADGMAVHLVNLSATEARTVVVQTGAYGENQCLKVTQNGKTTKINKSYFAVQLAPGCGGYLQLTVKRFANTPRAGLPWRKTGRTNPDPSEHRGACPPPTRRNSL